MIRSTNCDKTQPFCKVEFTILRKNKKKIKKICTYQKKAVLLHQILKNNV